MSASPCNPGKKRCGNKKSWKQLIPSKVVERLPSCDLQSGDHLFAAITEFHLKPNVEKVKHFRCRCGAKELQIHWWLLMKKLTDCVQLLTQCLQAAGWAHQWVQVGVPAKMARYTKDSWRNWLRNLLKFLKTKIGPDGLSSAHVWRVPPNGPFWPNGQKKWYLRVPRYRSEKKTKKQIIYSF